MSNQDEDEVEDELEAMEREVEGVNLPSAPNKTIVGEEAFPNVPAQRQKERAKARKVALEAL